MSSSYSYSHAQYHAPPVPQRRRITCLSCRQNRITCKPQSPHSPCERCARKNLLCQYVAVAEDDDGPSTSSNPSSRSHSYPSPAPVPSLPYTSAPPINSRPRYSGAAYPDLSLSSGRPPATVAAQHPGYPAQHAPSAHPGPQASRSRYRPSTAWANNPTQPQWPATPPAPQYPNPAVYGQPQTYSPMPFFADTAMPEHQQYEWSGLG